MRDFVSFQRLDFAASSDETIENLLINDSVKSKHLSTYDFSLIRAFGVFPDSLNVHCCAI